MYVENWLMSRTVASFYRSHFYLSYPSKYWNFSYCIGQSWINGYNICKQCRASLQPRATFYIHIRIFKQHYISEAFSSLGMRYRAKKIYHTIDIRDEDGKMQIELFAQHWYCLKLRKVYLERNFFSFLHRFSRITQ